jgi:hypothetical protein
LEQTVFDDVFETEAEDKELLRADEPDLDRRGKASALTRTTLRNWSGGRGAISRL